MTGLRVLVAGLLLTLISGACADDADELTAPEWQDVTYDRVTFSVPASWSEVNETYSADQMKDVGVQEDYADHYSDPANVLPSLSYRHFALGTSIVLGWVPLTPDESIDVLESVLPAMYAEMMPGVEVSTERTTIDDIQALRFTMFGGLDPDLIMHEYFVEPAGSGECLDIVLAGMQGRDEAILDQVIASVDIQLDAERG